MTLLELYLTREKAVELFNTFRKYALDAEYHYRPTIPNDTYLSLYNLLRGGTHPHSNAFEVCYNDYFTIEVTNEEISQNTAIDYHIFCENNLSSQFWEWDEHLEDRGFCYFLLINAPTFAIPYDYNEFCNMKGTKQSIYYQVPGFFPKGTYTQTYDAEGNMITTTYNFEPRKESENMNISNKSILGNFEFGKVSSDNIKLSLYGLAVKNKDGTWVSYDKNAGEIMNVDVLSFSAESFLYKIPVAISQIAVGDVIIHNRTPIFVTGFDSGHDVTGVDPVCGEVKVILPTKSPFGFNFVTKIVNLFEGFTGAVNANAENPFGNMLLPLVLSNSDSFDSNNILPLLLMSGGNSSVDSMLPLLLLNNNNSGNDNTFLYLALSGALGGQNPFAPKA